MKRKEAGMKKTAVLKRSTKTKRKVFVKKESNVDCYTEDTWEWMNE